jgi:4-oxalocrotonate tautomerase family enzyme
MPIIIVKTVKDAVLTSDEQKRELLKKMTDTFIEVVGEVARPFTYCIIEETPMYEWSLAGEPLPAFKYLTSPEWRAIQDNSVQIMTDYMAMMEKQSSNGSSDSTSNDPKEKERRALEAFGS